MAAGVESKQAAESWTIQDKLTLRESLRNAWERDFNDHVESVAGQISHFITAEVLEKIGMSLSSPYKPLPTASNPLTMKYIFDLRRNVSAIKTWTGSTDLPPFKEWFEAFQAPQQDTAIKGKLLIDEDAVSSASFIKVKDQNIEVGYFQELMAKIGHRVEATVRREMENFTANPQNRNLQTEVEWYRKAEKYISNPSSFEDNLLKVSAWIAEPSLGQLLEGREPTSTGKCTLL